jgi:hypothetical protein
MNASRSSKKCCEAAAHEFFIRKREKKTLFSQRNTSSSPSAYWFMIYWLIIMLAQRRASGAAGWDEKLIFEPKQIKLSSQTRQFISSGLVFLTVWATKPHAKLNISKLTRTSFWWFQLKGFRSHNRMRRGRETKSNRKVFSSPSSSPHVNFLLNLSLFHTEKERLNSFFMQEGAPGESNFVDEREITSVWTLPSKLEAGISS